ncbi:MAG TPA: carbohydrate binding domain-containing protein [Pyrinomonadaceae bacterium]|nr:carbohydrate binding domain-containing protein [Pyrinomonadaceae bacterium]
MPSTRTAKVRLPILIVGLAACAWGVFSAAREGAAQLLAGRALLTEKASDADGAVAYGPEVPEARYARAILLELSKNSESVNELERAAALRPQDYALWLELGNARDRIGDTAGAIAAFIESTKVAPFYAQPRWQLGNALFRAGRNADAVKELRLAAESNPKLALPALALAWTALDGNVVDVERAFTSQSPAMETALARFLVKRGKIAEAMRHFRAAGGISADEQRAMINDLLAAKNFEAAYEVWGVSRNRRLGVAEIDNGGFEESIMLDQTGFAWQLVQNRQGIQASLDPSDRRSGSYSLRVDWSGNGDTLLPIVSQLVLVEAGSRYQLRFAARGAELMMLGLPMASVVDASDAAAHSGDYRTFALASSPALLKGTNAWQDYSVEFSTAASTRAVIIRIHRENCSIQPCPGFGHAWFDDFSLTKLSQ